MLYLTGKIRRPDFEAQLSAAGINLTVAETYDTRPVTYSDAELNRIVDSGHAEVILLYSAVAARQFVALDKKAKGAFI
ncbi:uroporphyrinogen-III synthase, partial [Salmonella enterica]|nr:uroporphyrinogen-III synthase [Salmonella enterica]